MAIIPDFYINAVTSIGVQTNSKISWIGTGFFAYRVVDDKGNAQPLLVTNKHVLKDYDSIVLRIRKKESDTFDTINTPLVKNGKALYFVQLP